MPKNIEHYMTDEVVCPHCGYEYGGSWEYDDDDLDTMTCDECGKPFKAYREVDVSYITEKVKMVKCECGKEQRSNFLMRPMDSDSIRWKRAMVCEGCGKVILEHPKLARKD